MDGSVKFVLMICWTVFTFMFMDARIFAVQIAAGFLLLGISKIPFSKVWPLVVFMISFAAVNAVLLLAVSPEYGSQLTGRYTVLFQIFKFKVTDETVFYDLTVSLKYIAVLPVTLLFIFTTSPSNFASSLSRLHISYKVAYAVNIALRYIPDVQSELKSIKSAQEARGVAFGKDEASIFRRVRNYINIFIPLLFASLERIDTVSNAMILRGFGKYKKRTWFSGKPLKAYDYAGLAASLLLIAAGIVIKQLLHTLFWCIVF